MRDLTKSMTSYTWAMSVFWTQQMFNLFGLGGSGSWNRCTDSFEHVTDATAEELGDTMRSVFRSGDSLQRGMVDVFLAPFSFGNWCGNGSSRNGRGRGWTAGEGRAGGARDRGWTGDGRADGSRRGWASGDGRTEGSGGRTWTGAAARTAAAAADAMQAAVDVTARTARNAADAIDPQRPTGPPASDVSGGWGPVPR